MPPEVQRLGFRGLGFRVALLGFAFVLSGGVVHMLLYDPLYGDTHSGSIDEIPVGCSISAHLCLVYIYI